MADGPKPMTGRVLVVDDEAELVRFYSRVLAGAGHTIESARDGASAIALFKKTRCDAIVTDIGMPAMDGLELLRAVRSLDFDVPVIIITGEPKLQTAIRALEYGALRYLTKPVDAERLRQVVDYALRLHEVARLQREALDTVRKGKTRAGDRAGLEAAFDAALADLWMEYQPVVSWSRRSVVGYEALVRTGAAGLPDPPALLSAAEKLGKLNVLGAAIRERVAKDSTELPHATDLLVNLHPRDLLDEELYASGAPLTLVAQRTVLEITERASLDQVPDVRSRLAQLRRLGFRIALDDLGAGYAGLSSFALLEPDIVKLDSSLVAGVEQEAVKQRLVRSLVGLCRELGTRVIAECVETTAQRGELIDLGCDFFQGHLFAFPDRHFLTPLLPGAFTP
jgi:EAL domain-containing protein (putative c-di-GMP-specific phosphodiesterase class I)/CheY-like chemotaxis protein